MRVLLENTKFLLHKIVRIAGIIRVAGIIRGRALYEDILYFKTLSGTENLNKLFTVRSGKFKCFAQDSNLEYFFDSNQTF